jgi:hypothetical protein
MAALLRNRWFTAIRVLVIGGLAALIFSASPKGISTAEAAAIAVGGAVVGVMVGFSFAKRPGMIKALSKVQGHYYSLIAGGGFAFLGLWAVETSMAWPLLLWFLPAGVLESFVSSIGLARRQGAS